MQFDNSFVGTVNAGLGFGIFFMTFLVIFIAYSSKRKNISRTMTGGKVIVKGSYSKNLLVVIMFFIMLTVLSTLLLTNYFVSAATNDASFEKEKLRSDVERQLKDSLLTIDMISSKAQVDQRQIDSLASELEYTINKLQEQPSETKSKIVYVAQSGY